jgi:hypothetical protein
MLRQSLIRAAAVGLFLATAAAPAQAAKWFALLDPSQEVHSVTSDARGYGTVNLTGDILTGYVRFRDLTTPLTMAHIHCCAPAGANSGVALDFSTFPTTLAGRIDFIFDLNLESSYNAGFLAASGGTAVGARTRLLDALDDGNAYFNLHTERFRPGEIRGQIAVVPEPGTWVMLIAGFGLAGVALRRRQAVAAH